MNANDISITVHSLSIHIEKCEGYEFLVFVGQVSVDDKHGEVWFHVDKDGPRGCQQYWGYYGPNGRAGAPSGHWLDKSFGALAPDVVDRVTVAMRAAVHGELDRLQAICASIPPREVAA